MSLDAAAEPAQGHAALGRWFARLGMACAIAAALAAIAAGVYLWTVESWGLSSGGSGSVVDGTWVATTWEDVPERNLANERTHKVWAAIIVALAFLGFVAAARRRLWTLLAVATLFLAISVMGMMSIGMLVAPTALLFLLAFFLLTAGAAPKRWSAAPR